MSETGMITIERQTLKTMEQNAAQMGQLLVQMGHMLTSVQARLDDLEAKQAAVTVSHEDAKRFTAMIKARACELCDKYGLTVKDVAAVKAAIKKDVLRRCGVKDLHDIRADRLHGVENMIAGWTNIRLMMERRGD